LGVAWDDLLRARNQYGPLDSSGNWQRNRGRSQPADSRDLVKPDPPTRGHPLRNRSGSRSLIWALLHQRQWIESELFQRGPRSFPRIRDQRAVHRTGLLASRLEWDDLLRRRSLRESNSDTNTNGYGYSHSDSDSNGHSNSYAYTDSNAYGYSNSYAHTDSYAYGYSNGYAHTDSYAYVDADGPAETKPDTKATSDTAAAAIVSLGMVL